MASMYGSNSKRSAKFTQSSLSRKERFLIKCISPFEIYSNLIFGKRKFALNSSQLVKIPETERPLYNGGTKQSLTIYLKTKIIYKKIPEIYL